MQTDVDDSCIDALTDASTDASVGEQTETHMAANSTNKKLRSPQRLGFVGLATLVMMASLISPLSLDMYMPAVPGMVEQFNTTAPIVNFTLVGYFLFFSVGMLFFGPVTDKVGRKPIYSCGMACYALASVACALSTNIWFFIAMRACQAIGAGASVSAATSIVKDAFTEEYREKVLMFVQVAFVLGPILGPIVGAQILLYFTWRMTFWVLASVGTLIFVGTFFYEECVTDAERYKGSLLGSFKRMGVVARERGFVPFSLVISILYGPFMTYVSASSYIYVGGFGLSEQEFGFFFAAMAACALLGAPIYLRLSKVMSRRSLTTLFICIPFVSAGLMLLMGRFSPFLFFLSFVLFFVTATIARPFGTNVLLGMQEADTGSAVALNNFTCTMMSSLAMLVVSLPWVNYVDALIVSLLGFGVLALVIWLYILRSGMDIKGLAKK